jgi:hypothetical protein
MAEAHKKALVAQLALQRTEMTNSRGSLQAELSLSRQLKKSVRSHPKQWMIGGAVSAFALSYLFRRKKVIYTNFAGKKGLIRRTAGLAFTLARPALTTLALKHAKDYAEARFGPLPYNSMLGDQSQK